jgi:hypothetical protein
LTLRLRWNGHWKFWKREAEHTTIKLRRNNVALRGNGPHNWKGWRKENDVKHYIVTTRKGNQYRVSSQHAAEETFEARGGVSVEEVEVTKPSQQGYMFKPKGADRWQEWPAWEECND